MARKVLSEPVYRVLPGGKLWDYFQKESELQDVANEVLNSLSKLLDVDIKDLAIFSGVPGLRDGSTGAEKYADYLKVPRHGYCYFKKNNLKKIPGLKELSQKELAADEAVNPFVPHDVLGLNNLAASQRLDAQIYVGTRHELKAEEAKGEVEPVIYSQYLEKITKHISKQEVADSEN
ncbi:hypothetical protein IWT25_02426 [Secundilactobacillus pentosiphilus]|uniref:Uncharacterized protein n=1 Tax=Secundilactobacillus pentosiphilus TaxID=1714682 RepID=A0A1Z5IZW3_9LACO|nr:hypothetical protein [Secundilactobacillus pentosiphilus]GAX07078.1 hypothetical protein IWT25_02426 [Secundilactobacillus pentosiphilus]